MADYVLSGRAAEDIDDIADYGFSNFGVAKACEYGRGLEKCFENLADAPAIGLGADELAQGLRRYKYESHWVFYIEKSDGILVIRVLHQNMNFDQHIG